MSYDILIVGGGHGGAQAAIALRQHGFAGSIAIVGEEPDPPYERPPLSKDYLAGEKAFERILIRPAAFWADRDIALLGGQRVTAIDPAARTVALHDGETLGYGKLVWAAGGHARRLPCDGHDLIGVHTIRTRSDVDRLRTELAASARICVIGGGYIGLEAAAVLTGLGKQVTLVEAQDRVLARVAGAALSRFFAAEHRARGVDLRLEATVDRIAGRNGRVASVHLTGGGTIACDLVVVGIGIDPTVAPLRAAGAKAGNGVLVDAQCRTTLPDVYAIGDCALHRNHFAGGAAVRIESVQNAADMATTVARAICGDPASYDAAPWFWSNQYDLKLQTAGVSAGHDRAIVRGDPATRSFSIIYLRDGRVIALDCVNAVRDYVQGKALLLQTIDPAMLADPAVPLKTLAPAAGGPAT